MKKYFSFGFLMGILIFIIIYGVAVLDVCADGWVFKSDNDLRQHYLGFMAYRDSEWGFPLGMTDRLSSPYPMSIVYTDSIPIVAFVSKLLSPVLPRPFQYFGWYALLSFGLTAGLCALCLWRLVENKGLALCLCAFSVLSFTMLHRTFYHTSLISQWIILLCFYLWFSGFLYRSLKEQIIVWGLMGALIVSIHTYFLPMALGVLCMGLLEKTLSEGKLRAASLIPPLSMCVCAALALYVWGAFEIEGSSEYWIGDFTMNLNSFVNSLGHSAFFKGLPLFGQMQFEGAAYLGLGIFLLILMGLAACLLLFKDKWAGLFSAKVHHRRFALLAGSVIFTAASVLPVAAFGDRLLFRLPLTAAMNRTLGIFRSNGRFIWPVMYVILFTLAVVSDRVVKRLNGRKHAYGVVAAICVSSLLLQAVDLSPWIMEKHKKYVNAQKTYRTVWDEIELPDTYDGFVIFEDDNSFIMGTVYYAMRHDMTVNTFYFARDIDAKLQEGTEQYRSELLAGVAESGKIYVLDRETYEELKDCGLYFYRTRKCAFGVKDRIDALQELREEDLDEISWQ